MANEEALLVVIRVDEPAGDALGAIAANLAGRRVKHVHALHMHTQCAVVYVQNVDVGLAEDDEEIALACGLELAAHMEVGVHAGLEHWDASELAELTGMGLVVEGARDEDVEARVAGLTRRLHEIGSLDRAE